MSDPTVPVHTRPSRSRVEPGSWRHRLPFWRRALLVALRVRVVYADAARRVEAGPVILVLEHRSFLDGPLVALASPRPLHFAVNLRHACKHPTTRRLLRWMERRGLGMVVPMDRTAVFGLRRLQQALIAGESVCVFPEGRIADSEPLPEQPGFRWLAMQTERPVVRARIEGAERSRVFAKRGDRLWPSIRLTL